jgi:GcrA cell cycle regulator
MPAPLNNTNATKAWAAEHDAMLRACLADRATFDQAGAEINRRFGTSYTRCAVAGRAQRLGLKSQNPPNFRKGSLRSALQVKASDARRKPVSEKVIQMPRPIPQFHRDNLSGLRCAEVDPLCIALVDLEEHHCRFPVGGWPDATPISFCGQSIAQDVVAPDGTPREVSYCSLHHALSIDRGTASERRAHKMGDRRVLT